MKPSASAQRGSAGLQPMHHGSGSDEQIMALFQERESRDELGLGAIRDSIADHLFPGTSTIQTRLRYMPFIPWLFRMLEGRDILESQLRTEAARWKSGSPMR